MISYEERMKVVKALREPSNPLDIHASLYSAFGTCAEAVMTTVPADYYEHNNSRLLNRLADLIDRPTCHNASGHQDVCAQKPKARKRAIYLVTDFGGDWEDAWERPVIAFTDKARAEECAAKRETRQYDEYGPIWDYEGSEVKEIPLVDFGDEEEEK